MAGLQDMTPIVSKRSVTSAVGAPARAAAARRLAAGMAAAHHNHIIVIVHFTISILKLPETCPRQPPLSRLQGDFVSRETMEARSSGAKPGAKRRGAVPGIYAVTSERQTGEEHMAPILRRCILRLK